LFVSLYLSLSVSLCTCRHRLFFFLARACTLVTERSGPDKGDSRASSTRPLKVCAGGCCRGSKTVRFVWSWLPYRYIHMHITG
jgi:hypothetical protein